MNRIVVVAGSDAVRETVSYAIREARDAAQTRPVAVTVAVPVGPSPDAVPEPAVGALLDRIESVVHSERGDDLVAGTTTVRLDGASAPERVAGVVEWLPRDTTRVVLAPAFEELTLSRVSDAVAAGDRAGRVTVERAPVGRRVRRPPVILRYTSRRAAATFVVAFGFYLVLGDATEPFDVVTGLVSAGVVALVLSRVAFESNPSLASLARVARAVVYLPYLLVEVVRANVAVARVVLHPDLPIDPQVVRVPAPGGRVAKALLANSITLTPGTLTVDVVGDELVVHTLTAATREGLHEESLARAVAFVVDGRAASPGGDRDEGGA